MKYVQGQSKNMANVQTSEEVDVADKDTDFSAMNLGDQFSLPLNDFFKRPVKIFETELELLTFDFLNNKQFDPWDLWSSNVSVRAKLKNYYYFRGTMKLRFVFNSTRYHYGVVMISNQPTPASNTNLLAITNTKLNGIADEEDSRAFAAYLSQSPEVVYAKIGVDNNIEMTIPFISPKPFWRIGDLNAALVQDTSSFTDFLGATNVFMTYVNKIKVANDDHAANVPVQVYAWVEDVMLGPATATKMTIAQSKTVKEDPSDDEPSTSSSPQTFDQFRSKVNSNVALNKVANFAKDYVSDEYTEAGPIAQISSAVGNVAGKLSAVPIIGGAATAASKVFGGVAGLAKRFGFSKVVAIDKQFFATPYPGTNFAITSGYDYSQKLSLDPKQELATALYGTSPGKDEMAISTICARESYLRTIKWDNTDPPGQTSLGVIYNAPFSFNRPVLDGFVMTPLSFVGNLFEFWRGDITFRIEVVASQFHKGKLLIVWEPNVDQAALRTYDNAVNILQLNQQYSYILDLEETRDVEITVGFVSDLPFKQMAPLGNVDALNNEAISRRFCNGILIFTPFTQLTTPSIASGNNEVEINVYVRSDNIVFASPRSSEERKNYALAQSKTVKAGDSSFQPYSSQVNTDLGIKTQAPKININNVVSNHDNAHLFYFGESISSLRTLLKRSFPMANFRITKTVADRRNASYCYVTDMYPLLIDPVTTTSGGVTAPAIQSGQSNAVKTVYAKNPFDYLRRGFLYMKGGFRHKFIFPSNVVGGVFTSFRPKVFQQHMVDADFFVFPNDRIGEPESSSCVYHDLAMNRVVEVEVPFYNNNLMIPTTVTHVQAVDYFKTVCGTTNANALALKMSFGQVLNTSVISFFEYGSIAEDFSFHRFQGAGLIEQGIGGAGLPAFTFDIVDNSS